MNGSIEEQLKREGFYVSTTVGTSMRPMLRNRHDRVILRAVGEEEILSKYDLPLYLRPDGKYVLHRIIGVRDGYYIIRGDNTYQKEKIPREWILGVVTEFYRGKRHVLSSARSYRIYAAVWQTIYPIRLPLYKLRLLAGKIKRKLFPKKQKKQDSL